MLMGTSYRANHFEDLCLFGMVRSRLVSNDDRHPKQVGERRGCLSEPGVGTADDQIFDAQTAYVFADYGSSIQVIDRDAEEALDLRTMQVHGQDPIRAGSLNGIRTDSGSD